MVAGQTLPKRTVSALGRMVPNRQVEAVRTMVAARNLSGDFARALLAATSARERSDDARGRQSHPDCVRRLARMAQELARMQVEAEVKRPRYENELVCLALTAGFVRNWMRNDVVGAWLESHYPQSAGVLDRLAKDSDLAIAPRRPMKLPYAVAKSLVAGRRKRGK